MRSRLNAPLMAGAALLGSLTVGAPAGAQVLDNNEGGVATETQERLAEGRWTDYWDMLGLLGIIGLLGLRRRTDEEGYVPDPIDPVGRL